MFLSSYIRLKSNLFTIIFIAYQACFIAVMAQNEVVSVAKNSELTPSQELANLKQQKLAIEENLKKQEAVCYKKFAINDCLKEAKIEAEAALNTIKRREIALKDQLRNAKATTDRVKKEKTAANKAEKSKSDGIVSEVKTKAESSPKQAKSHKLGRTIKSDADMLADKKAADKARADVAQKRLTVSNKKQAASQKKAQNRAHKTSLVNLNSAKYERKLQQAEAHKLAFEKSNSERKKAKSAQLPISNTVQR